MTGLIWPINSCVLTGSLSTGALTDLVLEVPNGSLTRNRIARSPVNPAPDLRGSQPERPLALLDLVAEKLKPVSLTCTIRVFSVCRVTPSLASIRLATSSAARASPAVAARQQPVVGIPGSADSHDDASPNQNGVSKILLSREETTPP